jgi:hypothetical protein
MAGEHAAALSKATPGRWPPHAKSLVGLDVALSGFRRRALQGLRLARAVCQDAAAEDFEAVTTRGFRVLGTPYSVSANLGALTGAMGMRCSRASTPAAST